MKNQDIILNHAKSVVFILLITQKVMQQDFVANHVEALIGKRKQTITMNIEKQIKQTEKKLKETRIKAQQLQDEVFLLKVELKKRGSKPLNS